MYNVTKKIGCIFTSQTLIRCKKQIYWAIIKPTDHSSEQSLLFKQQQTSVCVSNHEQVYVHIRRPERSSLTSESSRKFYSLKRMFSRWYSGTATCPCLIQLRVQKPTTSWRFTLRSARITFKAKTDSFHVLGSLNVGQWKRADVFASVYGISILTYPRNPLGRTLTSLILKSASLLGPCAF